MKNISIDNGFSFVSPADALKVFDIHLLATYMDDNAREFVHAELAPCSDLAFLIRYLELAPYDLVIG